MCSGPRSSLTLHEMLCPRTLVVTMVCVVAMVDVCRGSVSRCPDGYYRAHHSHVCKACSACPVNQIIRRPCGQDSNTLCGPFTEFFEFHQAARPRLGNGALPLPDHGGHKLGLGDGPGSEDNRSKKKMAEDLLESLDDKWDRQQYNGHRKQHHQASNKSHRHRGKGADQDNDLEGVEVFPRVGTSLFGEEEKEMEMIGVHDASSEKGRPQEDEQPSLQDPEDGQNQWKVLALALIVVLCVVCVFLIGFVFVVCYLRSRRAHLKQVLYSAGKEPNSRTARRSFPSMQYVPVLTHAQGCAGTSGGGMEAPPCGMLDSPYLYSEDYDADHSGQTISTTKSSDYVYFKSPHNGNNVVDV